MEEVKYAPLQLVESEIVVVNIDIQLGDKFRTFKEFQAKLEETSRANFVRFAKRDSRTLLAAKNKTKRYINSNLEFYHLRYGCFYSPKYRPRGTGKRKKRSLAMEYDGICPASITVKASSDGEFLEVYHIDYTHNHPVNEAYYQKLLPKKRALEKMLEDSDLSGEDEYTNEDLYKIVIKKCKHIGKIAANADKSRLKEMVRNLDDYIFYLKYTIPKNSPQDYDEEMQESLDQLEGVSNEGGDDESIQIIVEGEAL
ncbi:uncharacterized protein [Euwallacea similis]|uniref:uncharacterized protein n=1 Tax=Euwallacea similis TaxID=1736056 RepID=UPI00345025D9